MDVSRGWCCNAHKVMQKTKQCRNLAHAQQGEPFTLMALWAFCAKNKPKTRNKHFLNSFVSSPFFPQDQWRNGVKFSEAPQAATGASGLCVHYDLRLKVVWIGKHITPQPKGVIFSELTISVTFVKTKTSKSLKYFANYTQRDQIWDWEGVGRVPLCSWVARQLARFPSRGMAELQGRWRVL